VATKIGGAAAAAAAVAPTALLNGATLSTGTKAGTDQNPSKALSASTGTYGLPGGAATRRTLPVGKAGVSGGTVVALIYRSLSAQENEPPGANPLGPELLALTARLKSLATRHLTAEERASVGPASGAGRAVGSLINRIRHLRSLLAKLVRVDPSCAARLAPELRALHQLLNELLRRPTSSQVTRYVAPPGEAEISAVVVLARAEQGLFTPPPAAPIAYIPIAGAGVNVEHSLSSGPFDSPIHGSTSRLAGTEPTTESAPLLTNLTISTGPSRSVTAAGASTSGAVGTLATRYAVRLSPRVLSGRLTVSVLPWWLAILRHRLERPG
jgi:hypothetical protein